MDNLRVALLLRLLIQERLGARQLVRKSLSFACERKDIFIRNGMNTRTSFEKAAKGNGQMAY